MNEIFRQSNIQEVLGLYSFIICPLGKGLPPRIISLLKESQRGSAAMSTTVLVRWCCLGISQIRATRIDPTGEDLCGTEGGEWWGCTGTGLCLSAVSEDEGWGEVAEGATAETGAGKRWGSLWCRGRILSFGGSWELLELEERCKLGLSRPKIWRGCLPPKLCCPGKEKHKLESPCSPPWQTCPLGGEGGRGGRGRGEGGRG